MEGVSVVVATAYGCSTGDRMQQASRGGFRIPGAQQKCVPLYSPIGENTPKHNDELKRDHMTPGLVHLRAHESSRTNLAARPSWP